MGQGGLEVPSVYIKQATPTNACASVGAPIYKYVHATEKRQVNEKKDWHDEI